MTKPLCSLNSFQMSQECSALCRLSAALIFNFQSPASVVNNTGLLFTEVTIQTELSWASYFSCRPRSLKLKVTVLGRQWQGGPISCRSPEDGRWFTQNHLDAFSPEREDLGLLPREPEPVGRLDSPPHALMALCP